MCSVLKGATQILYLHVKSCLAARADNGVLTLLLRKTKVVATGRTLLVHVCLLISSLALLKIEELLRFVCEFDESLVLLLSFINVL